MSTTTIPAQTIKTCDCCGVTMDRNNSRQEGKLTLNAHALDMQGAPCADATRKLDLCDSCLYKVGKAIDVAMVPPATQQDPAGWYVTGCSRLLDEDDAKTEARHIGGTARAIPLYTAPQPSPTPQADSQPAPVLLSDEELCQIEEPYLLNFRIPLGGQYDFARAVEKAVLAKTYGTQAPNPTPPAQAAPSVLEDAARLLRQILTASQDGDSDTHLSAHFVSRIETITKAGGAA